MAKRPPFDWLDPPPLPATPAEVDAALRPFIARFVVEAGLVDPRHVVELADHAAPGSREVRAFKRLVAAQPGIFLDNRMRAWRMGLDVARGFGHSDEELWVATGGGCALVHFEIGPSWLVTSTA